MTTFINNAVITIKAPIFDFIISHPMPNLFEWIQFRRIFIPKLVAALITPIAIMSLHTNNALGKEPFSYKFINAASFFDLIKRERVHDKDFILLNIDLNSNPACVS